jgi:hypothetical protein
LEVYINHSGKLVIPVTGTTILFKFRGFCMREAFGIKATISQKVEHMMSHFYQYNILYTLS